jgi:predicted AlkP superfamily pyrophosphatase or phosphodiesterase
LFKQLHYRRITTVFIFTAVALFFPLKAVAGQSQYVIEISVDGLGSSYLQNLFNSSSVPNIARIKAEGASTLNARDDYDYTVTLPNHVTEVTGRGVTGSTGHNWTSNSDPAAGQTIHSKKGSYVASVFDVAHDNGLRTSMYATKTKFSLFDTSYNSINGASDITGIDNGKDKIDTYLYNASSVSINNSFIAAMNSNLFNYSFIHYTDGDTEGHGHGWGSTQYYDAIKAVDGYLGAILTMIDNSSTFAGNTTIIFTADHGGTGTGHDTASNRLNYTIPFMVWGAGVDAGTDLYSLNADTRLYPSTGRPSYSGLQPIRNGDGVNLALELLGLGAIPGSTINNMQNLVVPEPCTMLLIAFGGMMLRASKKQ